MTRRFGILVYMFIGWTTATAADPPLREEPVSDEEKQHWAFRPPKSPPIPVVRNSAWCRGPIDRFIAATREAKGIEPAAEADKVSLLRRAFHDATGLLPTLDERDDFLNDLSPDAYNRLISRLLESPHFGERWAMHWLDTVRFAESNGYEGDADRPSAWRYRDYVVDALNRNVPFDRFVLEQIAGDELAKGKDPRETKQLWIATGLHRCGPQHVVSGNIDPEVNRNEVLTEMVQGIGSTFLGLTLTCARCHDHKFDPISQGDYYRMEAFFAAAKGKEIDFATSDERAAHMKKILDLQIRLQPVKKQVEELDAPYRNRVREEKKRHLDATLRQAIDTNAKDRTPEQQRLAKEAEPLLKVTWDEIIAALSPADRERREELRARQHAIEAELPLPPSQAWAIANEPTTPATYVLRRGDVKKKGALVQSAFPRLFASAVENPKSRLELAQWLTSPSHPLTARVYVNRVWQHYFGRGLVSTPNDFGVRGAKPSHPELLDWLARDFIDSGWDVKRLHRSILLSATYRQRSQAKPSETAKKIDPDNKLLWRQNKKRLEGETIRDNMLLASGNLVRDVGGPSVRIPLEKEVYDLIFTEGEPDGLWPVTPDVRQHNRRSLYLLAKRNVRLPLMEAFDQPDRLTPCADRGVSTFAPQALIMVNGPFSLERAKAAASSWLSETDGDARSVVKLAYRKLFVRDPGIAEVADSLAFIEAQTAEIRDRLRSRLKVNLPVNIPESVDPALAGAIVDFALALFNSNEFLTVP